MKDGLINFENLLGNLKVGICRCDLARNGKLIYANPSLAKILGLKESEITKKKIADLFVNRQHQQSMISQVAREGSVSNQ